VPAQKKSREDPPRGSVRLPLYHPPPVLTREKGEKTGIFFRPASLAADGVFLASLPEGPNPQKVLRTFPGTPPGRWLAERDGRSFISLPPRGRCRGLPRRKEFRLPVVSLARILSSLTPSVAYGDSSLEREPNRGPLAVEGVFVASLPEGPNPQKVLRTFPGTPPGRGTACGGRSPRQPPS